MPKIIRIDHVAILVEDLDGPLSFWRDALGLELTHVRDMPAELAEIAFLPTGGSEVELVRPTASDSGLARYLEKRGPGMHHVAFSVDRLQLVDGKLRALHPHVGGDGSQPLCRRFRSHAARPLAPTRSLDRLDRVPGIGPCGRDGRQDHLRHQLCVVPWRDRQG